MSETDDLEFVKKLIMECVTARVGEGNAITQGDLLGQLHTRSKTARELIPNKRTLLDFIHTMRNQGYVIGSGTFGYFKPADIQEALSYVDRVLGSRAGDLMKTKRAQKRAIINEYGGQLPLGLK